MSETTRTGNIQRRKQFIKLHSNTPPSGDAAANSIVTVRGIPLLAPCPLVGSVMALRGEVPLRPHDCQGATDVYGPPGTHCAPVLRDDCRCGAKAPGGRQEIGDQAARRTQKLEAILATGPPPKSTGIDHLVLSAEAEEAARSRVATRRHRIYSDEISSCKVKWQTGASKS